MKIIACRFRFTEKHNNACADTGNIYQLAYRYDPENKKMYFVNTDPPIEYNCPTIKSATETIANNSFFLQDEIFWIIED